jgi:hypothetical protein
MQMKLHAEEGKCVNSSKKKKKRHYPPKASGDVERNRRARMASKLLPVCPHILVTLCEHISILHQTLIDSLATVTCVAS